MYLPGLGRVRKKVILVGLSASLLLTPMLGISNDALHPEELYRRKRDAAVVHDDSNNGEHSYIEMRRGNDGKLYPDCMRAIQCVDPKCADSQGNVYDVPCYKR